MRMAQAVLSAGSITITITQVKRPTRKAAGSVAGQILGYLLEHQGAQDTLEGVAGWWIPQHRLKCELDQAKAALDQLVEKEFLVAVRRPDGRIHYRLNSRMEQEIREFLGQETGDGALPAEQLPADLPGGLMNDLDRRRRTRE
jgi:hypothetical protein